MEITTAEQRLEQALCLLSINSPVSFNMLVRIRLEKCGPEECKSMDTLGVGVMEGDLVLKYNPDFVDSLTTEGLTYVLIHEMMHVLLHHVTHRQPDDVGQKEIANVAMDLEVNSMIPEDRYIRMPMKADENGVQKHLGLLPVDFQFQSMLSYEVYFDLLMSNANIIKVSVDGEGNITASTGMNGESKVISTHGLDNHGNFKENSLIDEMIRAEVERIDRDNLWGNMPLGAVTHIRKAQESKVNWNEYLQLELGRSLKYRNVPSRRKWNKYYGKPYLGSTQKSVEPVAVYVDTSGSCFRQKDLSVFAGELERIAHFADVYYWDFESDVVDPEEFKRFYREDIEQLVFKGGGGTSFTPILNHAKNNDIRNVVILTDGYAEDVSDEAAQDLNLIWAILPGGNTSGKPGAVISIDK